MHTEHPNATELSPKDLAHLDNIRQLVRQALADGKLSKDEMQNIQTLIQADHQVTVAELATVHETVRQLLGDAALEYDWQ